MPPRARGFHRGSARRRRNATRTAASKAHEARQAVVLLGAAVWSLGEALSAL
jgi:hypothetical protein